MEKMKALLILVLFFSTSFYSDSFENQNRMSFNSFESKLNDMKLEGREDEDLFNIYNNKIDSLCKNLETY